MFGPTTVQNIVCVAGSLARKYAQMYGCMLCGYACRAMPAKSVGSYAVAHTLTEPRTADGHQGGGQAGSP